MSQPEGKSSFWTTLPGILTGSAALITAVAGLLGALIVFWPDSDSEQAPGQAGADETSQATNTTPATENRLPGSPDTQPSSEPLTPQTINTGEPHATGILEASGDEYVVLARDGQPGFVTDTAYPNDRTDFGVQSNLDAEAVTIVSSGFASFAEINGEVSQEGCFDGLRTQKETLLDVTTEWTGRWVCVQGAYDDIGAIRIDQVDVIDASVEFTYVVWD